MLKGNQAYKVARTLLKDYALECIAEEVKRRNFPNLLRQKMQAETLREIIAQTENFATHWAQFPARGLIRVKDLEGYVKRKLVAAGDFKDLRKKVLSKFVIITHMAQGQGHEEFSNWRRYRAGRGCNPAI